MEANRIIWGISGSPITSRLAGFEKTGQWVVIRSPPALFECLYRACSEGSGQPWIQQGLIELIHETITSGGMLSAVHHDTHLLCFTFNLDQDRKRPDKL